MAIRCSLGFKDLIENVKSFQGVVFLRTCLKGCLFTEMLNRRRESLDELPLLLLLCNTKACYNYNAERIHFIKY